MTAGEALRLPLRVYYEDTDAGGVVYYANYLKFMERARSEWMRVRGFASSVLASQEAALFVVHKAALEFRGPARLDDEVWVSARLAAVRRAALSFDQEVCRGDVVLCRGEITIVCVGRDDFRPRPIPSSIQMCLKSGSVA